MLIRVQFLDAEAGKVVVEFFRCARPRYILLSALKEYVRRAINLGQRLL